MKGVYISEFLVCISDKYKFIFYLACAGRANAWSTTVLPDPSTGK